MTADPTGAELPRDPRHNRFAGLSASLRWALWAAFAAAAVGTLTFGRASSTAGWLMFALVVGTPLVRTAWLARRWFSRGDPRYGAVAAGVLLIIAAGTVVAVISG